MLQKEVHILCPQEVMNDSPYTSASCFQYNGGCDVGRNEWCGTGRDPVAPASCSRVTCKAVSNKREP